MTVSMPPNAAETAYLAFAIVNELIESLIKKRLISRTDVNVILESAIVSLSQGSSADKQRASKFLANWMKSEP